MSENPASAAEDGRRKHRIVEDFLLALGVGALDVGVDDGLAARLAGGPLLLGRELQIDGQNAYPSRAAKTINANAIAMRWSS